MAGEERPIVVRFAFPRYRQHDGCGVRARLVWTDDEREQSTPWQELRFLYADHPACDAEPRDPMAMHWTGLHHAYRAQREAAKLNGEGDFDGARQLVRAVARRIREYAGNGPVLMQALKELEGREQEVAAPMSAMAAQEVLFQPVRRSRGQRDQRR